MEDTTMEAMVQQFIAAANKFDTEAVLALFSTAAVVEDVSVGEAFEGIAGVKKYFVTFFIGYHTSTQLLSWVATAPNKGLAKVAFKGDFGQETGGLDICVNDAGLIDRIDAYLD